MGSAFADEPGPLDITVTAEVIGWQDDTAIVRAIVEDGTAADGGDVEVQISGPAVSAYGIEACVAELESTLNRTLRPEYRLGAALALGAEGAFSIVTSDDAGPRIMTPAPGRLAA